MKTITADFLKELVERAGASARQRVNHNIHESLSDPVQRLFVASRLNSYFRPHRHPDKWEFAVVVRGLFDVIIFDDAGRVMERVTVGPASSVIAFEIPGDTWHAWVPREDASVFFETKQGPYDARTAAVFAPWSPEEGATGATGFARRLRNARIGELVTQGLGEP